MGFFSSPADKYSAEEQSLTEVEIKQLVSTLNVQSLDQKEEQLVEQLLIKRRRGDGKISLRQIYEVLLKLDNQNKISEIDRKGLMKVFENHFANRT